MSEDLRQHPRFRVALRAHFAFATGTVTTTTTGVSRSGMSVRLAKPPAIDERARVTLELPNGTIIDGTAVCRSIIGGITGMALYFTGDGQAWWDAFVDEEESTGSLWRMISRIAAAPDDAFAARGLRERVDADDLKFHTTGENGEAYRVAFEKHESDAAADTDLATELRGFQDFAQKAVSRVLREPMTLRLEDKKVVTARVAELARGGFAFVHGDSDTPTGLVSLGVGELVLVSKNGRSVFPHYTDDELERIACDTFRRDLGRPMFGKSNFPKLKTAKPAPVALPPLPQPPSKWREGLEAVRFAQAASDDVQTRKYGDRDVYFHPSVWARVIVDDGSELMGPTLHDGTNECVLGLVGPGAPRVIRLDAKSKVKLLKPPSK